MHTTMLSRLEAGLQNPIEFQAELIAECKGKASLDTDAFLASCAEYETATGKALRDEERAAILFATMMLQAHAPAAEAHIASSTPDETLKTHFVETTDLELKRFYDATNADSISSEDSSARRPRRRSITAADKPYHAPPHPREAADDITYILKSIFKAPSQLIEYGRFLMNCHDSDRGFPIPLVDELLSGKRAIQYTSSAPDYAGKAEVDTHFPFFALMSTVISTYLTKGAFEPASQVFHAILHNYAKKHPESDIARLIGSESAPSPLRNMLLLNIATSLSDVHRAALYAVQGKQQERQIPRFQKWCTAFGRPSILAQAGLFVRSNLGSVILLGQNVRMMSELTTFFRDVLEKPDLLSDAGLQTFHRVKTQLATQHERLRVSDTNWEAMYTALIAWFDGESKFCKAQHKNLQSFPTMLRQSGLDEDAKCLSGNTEHLHGALDMNVWTKHQDVLTSVIKKARLLTTTKEKAQFVQEVAWLTVHQDGFYMGTDEVKNAAIAGARAGAAPTPSATSATIPLHHPANPITVELELGLATEPTPARPAAPQRSVSEPRPGTRHCGRARLSDGSIQPTMTDGPRIPRAPRRSVGGRGTLRPARRLSEDARSAAVHMQTGAEALSAASPLTATTTKRTSLGGSPAFALRERRRRHTVSNTTTHTTGAKQALSFSGVLAAEALHPQPQAAPPAATGGAVTPPTATAPPSTGGSPPRPKTDCPEGALVVKSVLTAALADPVLEGRNTPK